MMIISGQSNYGKVDVVPRHFYVATRFFHLYYVPLVPLGTYVIRAGTENGETFEGVQIKTSWRSVFGAWVRAVLVLCMIAGVFLALESAGAVFEQGKQQPTVENIWAAIALCLVSALAYWVTVLSARARRERAHELAELIGLDPAAVDSALGVEQDLHEEARRMQPSSLEYQK